MGNSTKFLRTIIASGLAMIFSFTGLAQDELENTATFAAPFFAELLDVEMYDADTAYILGVGGFIFLDVSDMTQPFMIGRYDIGDIFKRFYNGKAEGNLAIGAARHDGLYLIDIPHLNAPNLRLQYRAPDFSYESVEFKSGYAYAAVHENGLEVIDISNRFNVFQDHLIGGLENAWDVFIHNNLLLVADGPGGLKVFSISDPQNPQLLSSLATTANAIEVIANGNTAYVAQGAAGFDIIDISDPAAPQFISNFNTGFGITNHIAFANDFVFAATWELALAVYVGDPFNPQLVATEDTPIRAMGIAASGNRVFVSDWPTIELYTFNPQLAPDIHIKPSVWDFGKGDFGQPVSKNFKVYNLGEETLQVSSIFVNHPGYSASPQALSVPSDSVAEFTLSYTDSNYGETYNKLKINSNDPGQPVSEVTLFAGAQRLVPGQAAPDFLLQDLNGPWRSLSDYRGKIVLLAFFASW